MIAQLLKHLMDKGLRTMRIANVHRDDATALAVFDDLNVRQRARDAVAHLREAASTAVSTGAIRLSENFWKQASVTGLAIRKQDQAMTIRQTVGPVL